MITVEAICRTIYTTVCRTMYRTIYTNVFRTIYRTDLFIVLLIDLKKFVEGISDFVFFETGIDVSVFVLVEVYVFALLLWLLPIVFSLPLRPVILQQF